MRVIHVGCASWSIPKGHASDFASEGTHLARYARRFPAVEINSSFYRPHRPSTYARWAAETPAGFRFAVKVPKEITHTRRLIDADEPLDRFLGETAALGEKRGPLLVQLPPSLAFDEQHAGAFFTGLRRRHPGTVACEPRHASWFTTVADRLLCGLEVGRVVADPAVTELASRPGGWRGLIYYRLHGSPRIYYSKYPPGFLDELTKTLTEQAAPTSVWCIFDNTAAGEATADAMGIMERLDFCTRS